MWLKKVKQRGQVLVLYALLMPIFILVIGAGLDLGWYYLNVSRLQNAADAAVLAGAHKLRDDHDIFKDKHYLIKLVHQYPAQKLEKKNNTTIGDEFCFPLPRPTKTPKKLTNQPPNQLQLLLKSHIP